jgi:serine/threonine protein kinase
MNEPTDPDRTEQHEPTVPERPVEQPPPPQPPPPQHPTQIGRYRVERPLGRGGFGYVYLAYDDRLLRFVAVKVPHRKFVSRPEDAGIYLEEARTAASLDHRHIVPVYHVDGDDAHPFYCVSKYIEGTTLAKRIELAKKQQQLPFPHHKTASLIATVAEALHYAHGKGVFHRDIKPANILLDENDNPYVADFGLALREEDVGKGPRHVGTPAFMSPEQALGEGHRVDGRADIFSLGVVFYELLTGRRAFRANEENKNEEEKREELRELILTHDPRPPRQIDYEIPKELERICLKALSKRAADRYTTAGDMMEELRAVVAQGASTERLGVLVTAGGGPAAPDTPTPQQKIPLSTLAPGIASDTHRVSIVPKGLRSFDAHDWDFFLDLLPGPRDREGLPSSIRFWKTRIEETDAENTFSVGLVYGPSGCGKTSLVRAGLLPRLSANVVAVYCEATAEDTEPRLLHALRKRCSGLGPEHNLKETLGALRQGEGIPAGKKVLIVIDQFEQWLHANRQAQSPELVRALRQCDGGRVQCIVMVRDDFWLASTRFMQQLEIRLVEGENSALVDLFDMEHARRVLEKFGRAYGRYPEVDEEIAEEGGAETGRQGDKETRRRARAEAQAQKDFVKQAVEELATEGKVVCVRLALFAEMMKSKPWTPATLKDAGGMQGIGVAFLEETLSSATAPPEHRYHQAAARSVLKALLPEAGTDIKGHMRSDADLLRASGYASRRRDFEDLMRILEGELRLITPINPEEPENGMESDECRVENKEKSQGLPEVRPSSSTDYSPLPTRHYQLTHDYLVPSLRDWLTRKQSETKKGRAELLLAERAAAYEAKPERRLLPGFLEWLNIRLLTRRREWTPAQKKMMARAGKYYVVRSVALAAALVLGGVIARESLASLQAHVLKDRLLTAGIADVPAILTEMGPYRRWVDPLLRQDYDKAPAEKRLRLSMALLSSDPAQVDYLYERLLASKPEEFAVLRGALSRYKDELSGCLWAELENETGDADRRFRAASALAGYTPEDPRLERYSAFIVEKLLRENALVLNYWKDALQPVSNHLLPALASFLGNEKSEAGQRRMIAQLYLDMSGGREEAFTLLEGKLCPTDARNVRPTAKVDDAKRQAIVDHAKRQANIGASLVAMGRAHVVWPQLKHSPDPTIRSCLIERLEPAGVDPRVLNQQIDLEGDDSIRRALILALGSFDRSLVPGAEDKLFKLYENDADPGIHGACGWVLRRWGLKEHLQKIDDKLATGRVEAGRGWYVNKQHQTFTVVPALVPSPRKEGASGHQIAMGATEVTVAQFRAFKPDHKVDQKVSATPDSPVNNVSWYDAAAYCNWLSKQERIPESQWCYERNKEGLLGFVPDYLKRTGYRLPTEAEWEFACRARAETPWCFGEADEELVGKYAWWFGNSLATGIRRSSPVALLKPNDWGLFDMHGNLSELCQESPEPPKGTPGMFQNDITTATRGGSYFSAPRAIGCDETSRTISARKIGIALVTFRLTRTMPEPPPLGH